MRAIYVLYILTALDFVSATLSPYAHKYFDDSSHRSHRFHRRRSAQHDGRFLGFRFVEEPSSTVTKEGRVQLNCRHALASSSNVRSVRVEWHKDGTPLSSLRPAGRV
ncbi:hypothetical protein Tcan_13115 [Toxocara canis]|uniref:Ig-like domain-containing protein n=1 Tax=Toxocara canis TaxID=6265 RepID=A0A0B2UNR3_TOXCA|nr:hypothetical protein Tcan_13115 [Toxocara canis]